MFYSAKNNGFFDHDIKDIYEAAGSWPDDAVEISEGDYQAMLAGQYDGKIIGADPRGFPVLIEPPALTADELASDAQRQQSTLMNAAGEVMAPLQDAVDIGEATDEEVGLLTAWKKYRVALNRLDLSTAPDIDWPEIPA